jgi:photosystem II stability/assembly factor-like uncharacterized protein
MRTGGHELAAGISTPRALTAARARVRSVLRRTAIGGAVLALAAGVVFSRAEIAWRVLATPGGAVRVIATAPDAGLLYAATNGGVLASRDGGTSWEAAGGQGAPGDVRALAVDPRRPRTVYAGTRGGLFKTLDAGRSWTMVSPPSLPRSGAVEAVVLDPVDSDVVYAAAGKLGVLRSEDGGGSWTTFTTGLTSLDLSALVLDPEHPTTLYVATADDGVFKSIYRGEAWFAVDDGLEHRAVRALALAPGTHVLYAGTVGGGIFRTRAGEDRWERAFVGLDHRVVWTLALDPRDPTTLYAGVSGGGAYWSTTAGASWRRLTPGWDVSVWTVAVDPRDHHRLLLGTATGAIATGRLTPLARLAAALGVGPRFRTVAD